MLDDSIFPKYILVEFDLYLKGKDFTSAVVNRLLSHNYSIIANDNMNITFLKN